MDENKMTSLWKEKTEIIKEFLENTDDYQQLCGEIGYILQRKLEIQDIEVSSVTHRCKTLKSFLEKISRKNYSSPFVEITDFAGVRVVYLYQNDFEKIEKIIKEEFNVIEKVDKLNDKGIDKFGYGAIHYIVKIGKKSTGARYDDLKNLPCEIQVRTVLQDAWAIIDHHLVYKKESEIPSTLQRKLNGLAGLFETADNQFENIREEREKYLNQIKRSLNSNDFLGNEVNLDTFKSYLIWKFPKKKIESHKTQLSTIFNDIQEQNFKTIAEIDSIVEKYLPRLDEIEAAVGETLDKKVSSSLIVDVMMAFEINGYYKKGEYGEPLQKFIEMNILR